MFIAPLLNQYLLPATGQVEDMIFPPDTCFSPAQQKEPQISFAEWILDAYSRRTCSVERSFAGE